MTNSSAGFALTLQACPVIFTTAGVTTASSSENDWPDEATILESYLAYTGWSWTERCSPIEGSLDCSGVTFTVHDLPLASVVDQMPAGTRPTTWLGTRSPAEIEYTRLTASMLPADSSSFFLDRIPATWTFPRVLYCDQEAILCDAGNSGTGQITGVTRGYFGTEARGHKVRANPDHKPRVWKDFPTFYRRKCVLWRVTDAGVATPLWRGYCNAPLDWDGEQTAYRFSCGPFWNVERQRPLGTPNVMTQIRGYDAQLMTASIAYSGSPNELINGRADGRYTIPLFANTIQEMCGTISEWIRRVAVDKGITDLHASLSADSGSIRFHIEKPMGILASPTIKLGYGQGWGGSGGRFVSASNGDASDPRRVTVILENPPGALIRLNPGDPYPVTRVDGMPSVWVDAPNTTSGLTTDIRYVLRGKLGSGMLTIEPTGVTSSGVGPCITFTNQMFEGDGLFASLGIVDAAVQLYLCARITSPHWLLALRYGVITNTGVVNGGIDATSWDWTYQSRVLDATIGGPNERVMFLDGTQTLDVLLGDTCKLHGCGIGLRSSKMSIFAFSPPLPTDAFALTVGLGDVVKRPTWHPMPDGIVNSVSIAGRDVNVNVNTPDSADLYAPARRMEVTLNGVEGYRGAASPDSLARYALQRCTGLWGDPCGSLTVATSIANLETAFIGDYAAITEYGAPVGDGTRGFVDTVGQIIGRKISIPKRGEGSVELEMLMYPHAGLAGYAPCCRVADITDDVLTIAVVYLTSSGTATDYAGSNLVTYPHVPDDGGVSWFHDDYAVQLVERDNPTPRTPETFTVSGTVPSSIPGTSIIELSGDPDPAWQAIIAGGGIVDLIFQTYGDGSAFTTTQKGFAFVADQSTDVIGTSTDAPKRFAP